MNRLIISKGTELVIKHLPKTTTTKNTGTVGFTGDFDLK